MEGVQHVLGLVGHFEDFREVRHEGYTTCVFATARDPAVHADLLSIPWGRRGQRHTWPSWRADRARPTVVQRGEGREVVQLKAVPARGNKGRLEWRTVVRALWRHARRRFYVHVRGSARLTATVEIEVREGEAEKIRTLIGSSLAADGDTWVWSH